MSSAPVVPAVMLSAICCSHWCFTQVCTVSSLLSLVCLFQCVAFALRSCAWREKKVFHVSARSRAPGADETNLSLFNTTSDHAATYPMLVGLGLMPAPDRLKTKAFEVLAFLPRLLPRHHKDSSAAVKADLKRRLTWQAISLVLASLDSMELGGYGYRCALCRWHAVLLRRCKRGVFHQTHAHVQILWQSACWASCSAA